MGKGEITEPAAELTTCPSPGCGAALGRRFSFGVCRDPGWARLTAHRLQARANGFPTGWAFSLFLLQPSELKDHRRQTSCHVVLLRNWDHRKGINFQPRGNVTSGTDTRVCVSAYVRTHTHLSTDPRVLLVNETSGAFQESGKVTLERAVAQP